MTNLLKRKGILFVVSAPSGTGKTTIAARIRKIVKGVKQSVSCTTRPKRENEKEGIDYHFISYEEFQRSIKNNKFIEWACVHNNLYGTPLNDTEEMLNAGCDILLTIDVQGACQLKKEIESGVYIFILPPSLDILRERLVKRMANTLDEIEDRLKEAENEIARIKEFDYIIVNKELDKAVNQVASIISAERCKRTNRNVLITKLAMSRNWKVD